MKRAFDTAFSSNLQQQTKPTEGVPATAQTEATIRSKRQRTQQTIQQTLSVPESSERKPTAAPKKITTTLSRICERIPGLQYVPDFISLAESKELMNHISQQPWLTDLKRRTQHYGYKYSYTSRSVATTGGSGATPPIPQCFDFLIDRLMESGIFTERPQQIIVNEYTATQGISKHVDRTDAFGDTVVSLSLLAPCVMKFYPAPNSRNGGSTSSDTKNESIALPLHPRSLVVLKDRARYDWMHEIPTTKTFTAPEFHYSFRRSDDYRRVSVTFRTVKKQTNERLVNTT